MNKVMRKKQVVLLVLLLIGLFASGGVFGAEATPGEVTLSSAAQVHKSVEVFGPFEANVFNGDIRDLPRASKALPGERVGEIPKQVYPRDGFTGEGAQSVGPSPGRDPLLEIQEQTPVPVSGREGDASAQQRFLESPTLNFPGQDYTNVWPPDPVGDIGPNYYIQMVNHPGGSSFTIYNKSDGSIAAGPTVLTSLGGSGLCADGHGDPIVLWDDLAGRWLMSEFSDIGNALCVYISQSSDPVAGGWYAYTFSTPFFPDYPKYGVWSDAYYVSSNEPSPALYAMERSQMLNGNPATIQRFTAPDLAGFGFQALTPADHDGLGFPPAPGLFIRHRDDEVHNVGANDPTQDFLELWEFAVDWVTPANSTVTGPFNIAIAEIDSDLCGLFSFSCFPQPGTTVELDPLREVVMHRLQHRYNYAFGKYTRTLVGNLVTDVDGTDRGGIRWFELQKSDSGPWTLFQEGTYSPDTDNRWMGSIAMDGLGDIALGFSISSSTHYPGIHYTGRDAYDPPGTMFGGEITIIDGPGSSFTNRWGDYSSMNVDPQDHCTFWYTMEYAKENGQWTTQIANFRFTECKGPSCNTGPPGSVDPAIEEAICAVDPYCCNTWWDSICVDEVTTVAGQSCDSCEARSDSTGSYEWDLPFNMQEDIAFAICQQDSFCCRITWDSICVWEVEDFDLGACQPQCPFPSMATNPSPANGATDVATDTMLAWNCDSFEGFEDGDLSEYTVLGGTHTVTEDAAHDGTFGLDSGGSGWMYRDDPGFQAGQGDTISGWVKLQTAQGRAYFGFGATAAGTYSVALAPNTDEFIIQLNNGFGFADLAAVPHIWEEQWYRVEIEWGLGGIITARLYDQEGFFLNSVSTTDSTFTSGGLAFRTFGGVFYFDTICAYVTDGVHLALNKAVKARRSYYDAQRAAQSAPAEGRQAQAWDEENNAYVPADELRSGEESGKAVVVGSEANVAGSKTTYTYEGRNEGPPSLRLPGEIEDFPSFDSTVVGSVGFIDDTQVGWFWSVARGDSVEETFSTGAGKIDRAFFKFIVPTNSLDPGAFVDWDVLINGVLVGSFRINEGQTGPVALDLKFPAIAGPNYTIRFEVKNEVAGGAGSHSLGYAGEHAGWLQLILTDTCPTTYDVYLGTTTPDTLVCPDTPIPMCDPGPLAPGTTYYWSVVSKGPAGETAGPTWTFTTTAPEPCSCDLNGSGGSCNFFDWLVFITDWGNCTQVGCSCDLDLSGSCNFFDWIVFIEDWGRTDCPVPRCTGQSCGNYTYDCNPQNPNCLCVKTAEGFGSCIPDQPCPPEECTTSAECPSGFICAVETCCEVGVCLEDNTCAPGAAAPSVLTEAEGPTIGGR
jgi:hypothetical protein